MQANKPMNPIQDRPSWIFVIEESQLQENRLNPVFPMGLSVLLLKSPGGFTPFPAKVPTWSVRSEPER
jgi:hypothetical protein